MRFADRYFEFEREDFSKINYRKESIILNRPYFFFFDTFKKQFQFIESLNSKKETKDKSRLSTAKTAKMFVDRGRCDPPIKPKFIPRTVVYGLKGEDNTNLRRVVAHAA